MTLSWRANHRSTAPWVSHTMPCSKWNLHVCQILIYLQQRVNLRIYKSISIYQSSFLIFSYLFSQKSPFRQHWRVGAVPSPASHPPLRHHNSAARAAQMPRSRPNGPPGPCCSTRASEGTTCQHLGLKGSLVTLRLEYSVLVYHLFVRHQRVQWRSHRCKSVGWGNFRVAFCSWWPNWPKFSAAPNLKSHEDSFKQLFRIVAKDTSCVCQIVQNFPQNDHISRDIRWHNVKCYHISIWWYMHSSEVSSMRLCVSLGHLWAGIFETPTIFAISYVCQKTDRILIMDAKCFLSLLAQWQAYTHLISMGRSI